MLRMAVLVSGGGTNLQAIIDSIGNGTVTNAEIAVVISNNRSAYALERAKQNGIDAAVVSPKDYETREVFNQALLEKIQSYQVDLVVLAGCLVVIPKIMVDAYDLWKIADRHLRHYMMNYLEIITVISTVMLLKSGTEENLEKKRELWTYIKNRDIRLFHKLRNRIMGQTLNLPGKGGRKLSLTIYKISQKVIGFN